MSKIKLYYNERKIIVDVPREVKKIYNKDNCFDSEEWFYILTSGLYTGGKMLISIDTLKFLVSKTTEHSHLILKVLCSANYQRGQISADVLDLFQQLENNYDMVFQHNQALILCSILRNFNYSYYERREKDVKKITQTKILSSDNDKSYEHPKFFEKLLYCDPYSKGLIPEEKIDLFLNLNTQTQVESLYEILSSTNYERGIISDDKIDKVLKEENKATIKTYIKIITGLLYYDELITDETLGLILKNKDELISEIISCINDSWLIEGEEKEYYILAVLNLENKEMLHNLYTNYKKGQSFKSMYSMSNFAKSFVDNSLSNIIKNQKTPNIKKRKK